MGFLYSNSTIAQLTATFTGYESRCAATGAIKIIASGGSGSYQYKAEGPVNTNFTNQDSITGLSPGTYTVTVNDISTNQTFTQSGIVVGGDYAAPGFTLASLDVSCENGSNGSITVQNLQNGRSPFTFSIVAPSPMGIGTSNSTGIFTGLMAGNYSIRLTDSCGGIQTRIVTINNYTWQISADNFTKTSCTTATGFITITDSKGNNSQYTIIPGFSYGVVTAPGDTIWSSDGRNFNIPITSSTRSVDVFARDSCGNIQKVTLSSFLIPSLDANVTISNKTCNDFTASVTGITNFFSPQFCLYDVNGNQVGSCNATGVFNHVPYGTFSIKALDACTDSTIVRQFTVTASVLSVSNNVSISNKICNSFSAAITGQQNLTNPTYCIINSDNGNNLGCNTTGIFDLLAYGNYCITTKDGCVDTTITRCFSVSRPVPQVPPVILPTYVTCTNFGLNVGGDSLTNPTYCLFDVNNNQVGPCNNTGIFDSIPLGSYCVTVLDACTDTTIKRCFNVGIPILNNHVNINVSNKTCTTFDAAVSGSNLNNPNFCLFNSADSSLISCNATGLFPGLSYGNYYVKSENGCPDTTFINSFSATRTLPTVNPNPKITSKICSTFTAQIIGQNNLISPIYTIINTNSNDTLSSNTSGTFTSLPYGSYLIQIVSGCNDTLREPFSVAPSSFTLSVTAQRSCYYGTSKFNFNVSGVLPVNIQIYNPGDSLITENNFNNNNFSMDSIPGLSVGLTYTVIATNACGTKDTVQVTPIVGYFTHTPSVNPECPGSVWPNGSGDIQTVITTNLGSTSVIVIKQGGTQYSPTSVVGSTYTFNNLGPATYYIKYNPNDGCGESIYDTITIPPYQFPNLSNSSAYQCDNQGFSIGAVVSGGVGPFTYQIFGSTPSIPALVVPPQSSPVFNINNGTIYSQIDLRALDACGNATIANLSILPLANNGIKSTENCMLMPDTLSIDTIYNSTYTWYFKTNAESTDSVAVGTGFNFYIPELLPTDTGVYVCHIIVNNGCIERVYSYHLDGSCYSALPISLLNFSGKFVDEKVLLNWAIDNTNDLSQIIIERKTNLDFADIGQMNPHLPSENDQYQFLDSNPGSQNFYRLKLVSKENTFSYSNVIFLQKQFNSGIAIYPNPVSDLLNVVFYQTNGHTYKISLLDILNQKLQTVIFNSGTANKLQIKRTGNMTGGIYILQFIDINTNEEFSQKVIFNPR